MKFSQTTFVLHVTLIIKNKLQAKSASKLSILAREASRARTWRLLSRAARACIFHNNSRLESYNLGQNKMEQQTPIPPKSRMKPRKGQKRAIFPSLIWGGGEGGV